jgi:hypothetical protein
MRGEIVKKEGGAVRHGGSAALLFVGCLTDQRIVPWSMLPLFVGFYVFVDIE